MAGIEEEISKFRVLPVKVKENLPRNLLSAEFYMLERILTNQARRFDDKHILRRYNSLFQRAKDLCLKLDIVTLEDMRKDENYDLEGFEKSKDYLLYRLNGGSDEMFSTFAGFRPDIQRMLASLLGPAEIYINSHISERAIEGEFCEMLSLAGSDRWGFYERAKYQVSLCCGWDSSEETCIQGGYDAVMKYVIDRILL